MQHIVYNAIARYPRLNRTYKFDREAGANGQTVPCDPMDDGAKYEMEFVMTEDEAKRLHQACLLAWEEAKANQPQKKWDDSKRRLPIEKTEEGIIGKTHRKGAYNKELTKPPLQVDAKKNPMPDDFMLTTGSKVNISMQFVPYCMSENNQGVSLRLRAVQVLELADVQRAPDPFSVTDGFTVGGTAGNDPFAAAAPAPANADLGGDDLPF